MGIPEKGLGGGGALIMAPPTADWSQHIAVDEARLKEYLARKHHGALLQTLPENLHTTLEAAPVSSSHDGTLRFGDSVMMLNHATECLLQADVSDEEVIVDETHSQKKAFTAISITTGKILYSCPRNVFTMCRVDDNDGYGGDTTVHYGQTVRISINSHLCSRSMYLWTSDENKMAMDRRTLLFPRASTSTRWRVLHPGGQGFNGRPVRINESIYLENVDTGCALMSDGCTYTNRYGNEYRTFAATILQQNERHLWSFVDESWTRAVMAAARERTSTEAEHEDDVFLQPTHDVLEHPQEACERELESLTADMATSSYSVCERIFPMIRARGMHGVRKVRRMCFGADVNRDGTVPLRPFEGILCYMSVRLSHEELVRVQELFPAPDGEGIDYIRFFRLMELKMPEVRLQVLRDAYQKLSQLAQGAMVNITDIQKHWNANCYPEVQSGEWPESEAYQDFLRQWEVHSADGSVDPKTFLDYYRDVSMAIESNAAFVEMVRCAWDL